jgi:hypothetical protein
MYCYAMRRQLNPRLWTAKTGLLQGSQVILQALAATTTQEDTQADAPPHLPLIWLTQNSISLDSLPPGSRWMLWSSTSSDREQAKPLKRSHLGMVVDPAQPLQQQLQQPLR